jgi:hypothetical protein
VTQTQVRKVDMNLHDVILEEHSKANTLKITNYIGDDKVRFKELMQLFFGDEYRVTQRAAWAVGNCAEVYPQLLKPYMLKMTSNLYRENLHDAIKRNTLRVFQFVEIPESIQGKVYDVCMKYLLSINESIAVKAFSITVLHKISMLHPDLQDELKLVLNELYKHETSPAIISRCKKALTEMDRIKKDL